ncbi:MAG: hypothetical protein ACLTKI_05630 [Lachnospiraceae bacterium]
MVIQTISKQYKIIQTLVAGKELEAYLCVDESKADDGQFLLLGLTGSGLSKNMVPYFLELSSRKEKGDFLDCFTSKGNLWLVFAHHSYTPLLEKMKEPFLQSERLEASKSLMEKMLAQNLPYYLQYEALDFDNLSVSQSCEVYFNYLLKKPELFEFCRLEDVCGRLAGVFGELFSWELEEETSKELVSFIQDLNEKSFHSYTEVYREYTKLYEQLVKLQQEGSLKPKGWLVRLWERLKRLLKRLWQLLYIALLIGLVVFLIYTCVKPADLPAGRVEFDRIGTLDLKNSEETSTQNEENPE